MRYNGKEVLDAVEPLTIRVMRRDIDAANQGDSASCAIAQCLRRRKGVKNVSIGAGVALVEAEPDVVMRYVLSPEDRKKVRAFDAAGYFMPDTYTLLPPPPRLQIGARRGTPHGSNKREGKARSVFRSPSLRHVTLPHPVA